MWNATFKPCLGFMADWSGMFLPKTRMNEDSLLESCNYRWPLVNPFEDTREWWPAINPLLLSKHAALCTKPNQNIWKLHSVQGTIPRSITFLSIYCHKYHYKHQCYNLSKQNKRYKRNLTFPLPQLPWPWRVIELTKKGLCHG